MKGGETPRDFVSDLIGLDARPRPASMRARIFLGLRQSAPFSSLQRRIIFFNLIGLAFLVMGVLYLNQFRSGLIEQRVQALRTQGQIIAITIAETASDDSPTPRYDVTRANVILDRLAQPTGVRARLYDKQLRLTGDTRSLALAGAPIEVTPLAPPGEGPAIGLLDRIEAGYKRLIDAFRAAPPIYPEVTQAGISRDAEVRDAALGMTAHAVRINSQGELIVSVALPVTRLKAVMGVVVLSTEGDDINAIVRNERVVIFQVFFIATAVSVALSLLLANTIANPIRKLAEAADPKGTNAQRPLNPERIEIPDMTHRTDEIGDLSAALIRMTQALYKRIEAIESFAADVAHEIKNPLTSLRSAVETMDFVKTEEQRTRLLGVIQQDVTRLDRLVTDISNASRLDAELVRERMEPFDLGALIAALAAVTQAHGEDRRIKVEARLPRGPYLARGLEGRLAQVVTNVLDNALSFAPEGSTIVVEGRRHGAEGVRVTVSDQGPGIPDDSLDSIFERFYSERPEAEAFGNHSGLGLSISRQIVEAHGGRIWAENIRDQGAPATSRPRGARFVIELPG